jgi:aspartate 1-decarboxylase
LTIKIFTRTPPQLRGSNGSGFCLCHPG